jgi:hypothetical protein
MTEETGMSDADDKALAIQNAADEVRLASQNAGPDLEREHEPQPGDRTAADKVRRTLKDLSMPDPEADGIQLALASIAMGVESQIGDELDERQSKGEVDEFVLALTQWIAMHRSDHARRLVVVELPRRELPAGTRLHLLDEAIAIADQAKSPL